MNTRQNVITKIINYCITDSFGINRSSGIKSRALDDCPGASNGYLHLIRIFNVLFIFCDMTVI